MSPDVNDPAFRAVTFDDLYNVYTEQWMVCWMEVSISSWLKPIFDTLNAKAAVMAILDIRKKKE